MVERFHMRVSEEWREVVSGAADRLGCSVSAYVASAAHDVAEGLTIPAERLREAISLIEDAQSYSMGRRARRTLDDLIHVLLAAMDGEHP